MLMQKYPLHFPATILMYQSNCNCLKCWNSFLNCSTSFAEEQYSLKRYRLLLFLQANIFNFVIFRQAKNLIFDFNSGSRFNLDPE